MPLPPGSRRDKRPCRAYAPRTFSAKRHAAFSLVELMVVIAVIAILFSILLPSLRAARDQARMSLCAQRLRDFGTGLAGYAGENADYLPGVNTSGVAVSTLELLWATDPSVLYRTNLPVQSWDWMTPILAPQMALPTVRAEKWKFLLDDLRCPAQCNTSLMYHEMPHPDPDYPPLVPPDVDVMLRHAPFPTVSWLMPAAFQFFGNDYHNRVLGLKEHPTIKDEPVYAKLAGGYFTCHSSDYLPRLDRVGPPARKVFVADGMRYCTLIGDRQLLDFDTYPHQDHHRFFFGSFSSAGAWWTGSTAYGVSGASLTWDGDIVDRGSKGQGLNLSLSYRHGARGPTRSGAAQDNAGMINAVFFDGHVERMGDRRSRDITLWYPTGTVVDELPQGMTRVPPGFVIP